MRRFQGAVLQFGKKKLNANQFEAYIKRQYESGLIDDDDDGSNSESSHGGYKGEIVPRKSIGRNDVSMGLSKNHTGHTGKDTHQESHTCPDSCRL